MGLCDGISETEKQVSFWNEISRHGDIIGNYDKDFPETDNLSIFVEPGFFSSDYICNIKAETKKR